MKVAFFDPVPYEAVLKPLVKIKEELALAKIGREQLAKDLMADATERVQTAVKEVNFGWDDLALQPAMPCYVGVFPAKIEAAHRQADVVYAVCNKEDGPLFVNRSLDAEKLIGSSNNPISTCRVVDRELALASAFDSSSQKAAADDLRFSVNAVENRYQRIKNATEIKPYMIPGCTAH
jgi:hypothetical protein